MKSCINIAKTNIASQAQEVLNKAPAELSAVLSTGLSFLQLYRDPAVAANISESNFKIHDLVYGYPPDRERGRITPISLYLAVTPSDQDRMRPLLRLFFNMVIRNLMEDLPDRNDWSKRLKLLLLIDEFPSLKFMSVFKETLGYAAGFGIKAMLVAQDFIQIEDSYKKADIITTHCEIQLAMAPTNQATAEHLSKSLGKSTVNTVRSNYSGHRMNPVLMGTMTSNQESARDLMTPDEIKLMDGILIYFRKSRPIMGEPIVYYADPEYSRKLEPPVDADRSKYRLWKPPAPANEKPAGEDNNSASGDTKKQKAETGKDKKVTQEEEVKERPREKEKKEEKKEEKDDLPNNVDEQTETEQEEYEQEDGDKGDDDGDIPHQKEPEPSKKGGEEFFDKFELSFQEVEPENADRIPHGKETAHVMDIDHEDEDDLLDKPVISRPVVKTPAKREQENSNEDSLWDEVVAEESGERQMNDETKENEENTFIGMAKGEKEAVADKND